MKFNKILTFIIGRLENYGLFINKGQNKMDVKEEFKKLKDNGYAEEEALIIILQRIELAQNNIMNILRSYL